MPALGNHLLLPPDQLGVRTVSFRALGTKCHLKFRHSDDREALAFAARALDWIGKFEAKYSRFRPDSLVSQINAASGKRWVRVDREMEQLLDVADELFTKTEGILDATMLPLLRVWNWKVTPEHLPDRHSVENALALTGWDKVQRRPGEIFLPEEGMGLDFGGFGKELAVDSLVQLARQGDIKHALIDLGRDVFALGGNGAHPFWHIGIEDGTQPGGCWGGLAISDRAVSASGNYARHFTHNGVRYGHILDPRTGWPVSNGMHAVTVVAKTCLEAGIYSTATYVLGPREGLQFSTRNYHVDVCLQSDQGIDGNRNFGRWLVRQEAPSP